MGTLSGLEDLAGLAADMARLEMDRDSCDIVFVVRVTPSGDLSRVIMLTFPGRER